MQVEHLIRRTLIARAWNGRLEPQGDYYLTGPDSTRWGHLVVAGCWAGTLNELAGRISPDGPHGWGEDAERWRADYGAVIAMARVRVAEWEAEPLTAADHERWKATR